MVSAKKVYANMDNYNCLEVGFAAFFLNRCNRSGILRGGVIGGINQSGKWKINERFNKVNLITRIKRIGAHKENIKLYNQDTCQLLKDNKARFQNFILYLDPPYYNKGPQLYKNHYTHGDHISIANEVKKLKGHWIVSYDNTPEIAALYNDCCKEEFNINYSAGQIKSGKEIMFFSKSLKVPQLKIC